MKNSICMSMVGGYLLGDLLAREYSFQNVSVDRSIQKMYLKAYIAPAGPLDKHHTHIISVSVSNTYLIPVL